MRSSQLADVSLNTEPATLAALSRAAADPWGRRTGSC